MVFCDKCGAIMTGSVCQRCGAGLSKTGDSKSESDNNGEVNESSGNSGFTGVLGGNQFGGAAPSPFAGGGTAKSPFAGGGAAPSPFTGKGTAPSPFAGNGSAPSPFAGGGATKSPFASGGAAPSSFANGNSVSSPTGNGGSSNSPFGGSAFGFGAFGSSGFGNTNYGSPEDVAERNRKNLVSKLERYKDLLAENEELETMIKPQSSFPVTEEINFKKRSFMKYFWPYLVAAPVIGYIINFISSLMTVDTVNTYDQFNVSEEEARMAASRILSDAIVGYAVAIIVVAAIIIFGIVISKRKQAEFNSSADYMNREASERYQKGLENQRMINLQQSNIQEMHQYESLVPKEYRTAIRVGKIIEFIKNGDADTVEDACDMINTQPDPEPEIDTSGIFS